MNNRFFSTWATKYFAIVGCALALSLGVFTLHGIACQTKGSPSPSAAQLLKEGSSYQSSDDISDRAAESYRLVIQKYPRSVQAEQAQFYLGSYYQKKFFILEHKSEVQDWSSVNKAEDALYTYVGRYPGGSYVADSYHTLAIIALRRGYRDSAKDLLRKMAATRDRKVYMYKVVWTPRADDVSKGYCDTKALASANLDVINKYSHFDAVVNELRNWCRSHCK